MQAQTLFQKTLHTVCSIILIQPPEQQTSRTLLLHPVSSERTPTFSFSSWSKSRLAEVLAKTFVKNSNCCNGHKLMGTAHSSCMYQHIDRKVVRAAKWENTGN